MTLIEVLFFLVNAAVSIVCSAYVGRHMGYVYGILCVVPAFFVCVCVWTGIDGVLAWICPIRPRCKNKLCRAADYTRVLSDERGIVYVCKCGDRYRLCDGHFTALNPDGTPEAGTEEIVSTLESVIKRDPNHLGALHYYIHTVEASNSPERALAAANRLAALAPGAGHIVHMPALAVARLWFEGNAFSPLPTGRKQFESREWAKGASALAAARDTESELAGVTDVLDHLPEWNAQLLRSASATPGGPIEHALFEAYCDEVLADLVAARPDAVYLSLHGAAITDQCATPDLELVKSRRTRGSASRSPSPSGLVEAYKPWASSR